MTDTPTADELVKQLTSIADLADKATPGTWSKSLHDGRSRDHAAVNGGNWTAFAEVVVRMHGAIEYEPQGLANLAFIAASRSVPYRAAADMLKAQAAEIERLKQELTAETEIASQQMGLASRFEARAEAAEAKVAELEAARLMKQKIARKE